LIERAPELQHRPYHHVVEANIRGFFEHMDHDWALQMLGERIDDNRALQRLGIASHASLRSVLCSA